MCNYKVSSFISNSVYSLHSCAAQCNSVILHIIIDIWKQLLLRGGKSADVMISFENPLDIPLTDIEITMDGAGLIHYDKPR